jgi:hypothetical protein
MKVMLIAFFSYKDVVHLSVQHKITLLIDFSIHKYNWDISLMQSVKNSHKSQNVASWKFTVIVLLTTQPNVLWQLLSNHSIPQVGKHPCLSDVWPFWFLKRFWLAKELMVWKKLNAVPWSSCWWSTKWECICWRSLLWRGIAFHPCKYSSLVFTVLVLLLFDQASYTICMLQFISICPDIQSDIYVIVTQFSNLKIFKYKIAASVKLQELKR